MVDSKFLTVRLEKSQWICKRVEILQIYLSVGVGGRGKIKGGKDVFENDFLAWLTKEIEAGASRKINLVILKNLQDIQRESLVSSLKCWSGTGEVSSTLLRVCGVRSEECQGWNSEKVSGSVQLAGMMVLGKPREIQAWSLKKSLFLSREVGLTIS